MDLQAWLNLVCQMLPKVKGAILVTQVKADPKQTAARWPQDLADATDLYSAVPLAAQRHSPVFSMQNKQSPKGSANSMLVAHPLLIDGQLFAVLALELEADANQQKLVSQLLLWAQAWLQLLLRSEQAAISSTDSGVIGALAAGMKFNSLDESMTAAASQISQSLDCERVSIGLLKGEQLRVSGVSHSAVFDCRANLIRSIEEAMEETRAQRRSISFPTKGATNAAENAPITIAHQRLSETGEQSFLCSVPLLHEQEMLGVLMFERHQAAFDHQAAQRCEAAAQIITSLILIKQQPKAQAAWMKTLRGKLEQLLKPGHLKLKLISLSLVLLGLLLTLGEMQYRVRAPALLEGSIQRAVVAPFDGYVADSFARAGEVIAEGAAIAELDDREMRLEHRRWLGQKDEYTKQYRQALSELDYVQAKIFKAQIAQADAQLTLLQDQVQRARLISPIAGVIISGDLSRTLGAPVERGQVLFEVAPLNEYRLVLMVDEREIKALKIGQRGLLSLSALPGQQISFEIERVATVFEEQDDRVVYRTEARLETDVSMLRPGMQGVGKVDVGARSIGWILFHRLFDWIRFELWSWLP